MRISQLEKKFQTIYGTFERSFSKPILQCKTCGAFFISKIVHNHTHKGATEMIRIAVPRWRGLTKRTQTHRHIHTDRHTRTRTHLHMQMRHQNEQRCACHGAEGGILCSAWPKLLYASSLLISHRLLKGRKRETWVDVERGWWVGDGEGRGGHGARMNF